MYLFCWWCLESDSDSITHIMLPIPRSLISFSAIFCHPGWLPVSFFAHFSPWAPMVWQRNWIRPREGLLHEPLNQSRSKQPQSVEWEQWNEEHFGYPFGTRSVFYQLKQRESERTERLKLIQLGPNGPNASSLVPSNASASGPTSLSSKSTSESTATKSTSTSARPKWTRRERDRYYSRLARLGLREYPPWN